MYWVRICAGVLVGVWAMQCLALAGTDPTDERTRTFPELNCRFTLPGSDWEWVQPQNPGIRCMARNSDGMSVNLTAMHLPGVEIGPAFAKGFDNNYFTGELQKRDGKFITFLGLPCYEARGRLTDSTVTVARVFAANDHIYSLTVGGGDEPIEDKPVFEEALRAFEFTSPPVLKPSAADSDDADTKLRKRMGGVAAMCLMGALVLGVAVYLTRSGNGRSRKSSPKKRQSESIFLDDDE